MNELAAWVPNTIMAMALLAAIGALWKAFSKRLVDIETTLKEIIKQLPLMATVADVSKCQSRIEEMEREIVELRTACKIRHGSER
jgi:TolA-binding protein